MFKKALAGIFVLSCAIYSLGQTSVWYFGNNAGLRFTSSGGTTPEPGSAMVTNEGCTAATDNSGNLLFYADGQNIWHGASHSLITSGMLGSPSSTQAALVVPLPGNACTRFLLFTTEGVEVTPATPNGLGVAMVTVTGTYPGQIVTYDPAVSVVGGGMRFSEKLAVTPDGSGGYWLVAHDYTTATAGGTTFYKYHITNTPAFTSLTTSAGAQAALAANLTTQSIGVGHNTLLTNAQGQMKFNTAGTKLGLAIAGAKRFETFNFSAAGVLSLDRSVSVAGNGNTYGFEFAPGANLAYVAEGIAPAGTNANLYQYDLTPAVPSQSVLATATATATQRYVFNALQLGPNNRIYVAGPFTGLSTLSVINNPNITGVGCGYSGSSVAISGTSTLGLPTVIAAQVSCDVPSTAGCNCNGVSAVLQSLTLTNANGSATASILLNSGSSLVKKVRITLLNYIVTPSNVQCKNYCAMGNSDFGHFVSPAPSLTGFTAAFSPFSPLSSPLFSSDIELTTAGPRVITNEAVSLNLKFPPIMALSCCSQTVQACFRVEYIDADCRICDVQICNTSGHPNGQQQIMGAAEGRESIDGTSSDEQELSVYPNPNNGNFVINTAKIGPDCRYQVTTFEGREIVSGEIRGEAQEISQQLAPGTYSVFVFKDNRVFTEKIIVMQK